MMKISSVVFSLLALISLLISGCSDTPSSLGAGLIPQEDFLNVDTLTAYSATERSYLSRHTLGLSRTIAVGRTGSLEAEALIWFFNFPDTMKESTVNSVDLTLFPNYIAGDSTGAVSFDVHEITSSWTESGVIWDSLTALSYNGTPVGSFSGAVADSDSIVISISPQLISKWFTSSADTLPVYGFLLKPNSPPAAGTVIRGFGSFQETRVPRLRIIATQNSQIDTFTLNTGYDTYAVNGSPIVDPTKSIYVHPTLAYNGLLVFDVSKLPRDAVIHQSMLELTRNTAYQYYSRPAIDSVIATFVLDSMARSDLSASSPPVSNRNGDIYRMNISSMVQRWVKGFPNQGVRIKAYDDNSGSSALGTLNPFVFYNSKSDPVLRPRLKIIYSTIQ